MNSVKDELKSRAIKSDGVTDCGHENDSKH
jgi:hypothetical protein